MAGAGYKAFADGDVLTAAQVQTYLQDQAVMKFADSSARSAALGTAVVSEGMVSYLADTDAVEVYDGSSWSSIAPAAAVKQVVTTTLTTAFSASVADNTWQDITGLAATITPTSASSTLVVAVTLGMTGFFDGLGSNRSGWRVYDGSAAFGASSDASSRNAASAMSFQDSNSGAFTSVVGFTTSGSAGSTSARTYTVQVHNAMGSTKTVYVNRTETDTDSNDYYHAVSNITVWEV